MQGLQPVPERPTLTGSSTGTHHFDEQHLSAAVLVPRGGGYLILDDVYG